MAYFKSVREINAYKNNCFIRYLAGSLPNGGHARITQARSVKGKIQVRALIGGEFKWIETTLDKIIVQ